MREENKQLIIYIEDSYETYRECWLSLQKIDCDVLLMMESLYELILTRNATKLTQ